MSLPGSSNESTGYSKPRADLYTVVLIVALLALIVGTVFLYLETKDYGSPPYQGAPSALVVPGAPLDVLLADRAPGACGPRADLTSAGRS